MGGIKLDNMREKNYDEMPFIVVKEDTEDKVIYELCDAVFLHHLSEEEIDAVSSRKADEQEAELEYSGNMTASGKDFLTKFLLSLPRPFTIVQENYHIDRSFRDTYYMYFSNQHFNVKRFSLRLSFFIGEYGLERYFSSEEGNSDELERNFIGCCVINPLIAGSLGRTLIAPQYALRSEDMPAYMRLSEFKVHIYGRTLSVRAFPYRMQDQETMCCAEVTLLNMLEYYSNSYNDYKAVVPSEIIEKVKEHSHERVLPSRGITYPVLTKVLSEFGFSPRMYNISAISEFKYSAIHREDELRRWLHYYIESGIPVAINLAPVGIVGTGHSVVCIGHGRAKDVLKTRAYKNRWIPWEEKEHTHPIINSADFYEDYVVVDDNQPVYQVRKFKNLSLYSDMKVVDLAVPLYKRMFLDAPNAFSIIRSLLHSEQFGIDEWAKNFLDEGESVIIRMFMASSCSYKAFRMKTLSELYVKELYTLIPMPRFIWVCELYRVSDYDNLMSFGEIVIDATSAPNRGHRSLILMHYPKVVAYRSPNQTEVGFDEMAELECDQLFPGYRKNMNEIKRN